MAKRRSNSQKGFQGYSRARDVKENVELTHVGPGTPCGEYLRRFWQPVVMSSELGALPLNVRVLGEDLVLFRTRKGETGLVERHCSHRGASLEYGITTEEGIRCCYHGWHYAVDGTILETPNDPASRIGGQVYHSAYPTHEYEGIVFAYMGPPEAVPDFPILDTYLAADNDMMPFSLSYPCNWLQIQENSQDPTHSCFLHTRISGVQFGESWGELPELDYVKTPIGMINVNVRRWKDKIWVRTTEDILPNMSQAGALWLTADEEECFLRVAMTEWARPVDDTNTKVIGWRHFNDRVDPGMGDRTQVGSEMIDFIGQTEIERSYQERQRVPGDFEAIVSQRPIAIHGLENLNLADRGVTMLRGLIRRGIRAVKAGKKYTSMPRRGGAVIPTYTQDTVITFPREDGDDRKRMRDVGHRVAKVVLDSDQFAYDERPERFAESVRRLS